MADAGKRLVMELLTRLAWINTLRDAIVLQALKETHPRSRELA
jgi:hypothetical protein